MRRLSIYISLVCAALLIAVGTARVVSGAAGRAPVATTVPDGGFLTAGDVSAAEEGLLLPVVGVVESGAFSGGPGGARKGISGARCFWMTVMRRAMRSPVFQSTDLFLTYLGRASAARAFASWRMSLCGNACGAAVAVSRAGDGCVYALRRIVI